MKKLIRTFISKQTFHPDAFGVLINPYYIARSHIDKSMRRWGTVTHGRLLDVGCGSRPYEIHFLNVDSYIGVDLEQSGHPLEKKRADFFYDGKVLPFKSESFDSVLFSEVLEHVFNPEEVLHEIRRVLSVNGKLLITIPFAFPEHEQPYDFGRYTRYGLKALLERVGFSVVKIENYNGLLSSAAQLVNSYIYNLTKGNAMLAGIVQLFVCAPITILGIALEAILPNDSRICTGFICECQKI